MLNASSEQRNEIMTLLFFPDLQHEERAHFSSHGQFADRWNLLAPEKASLGTNLLAKNNSASK